MTWRTIIDLSGVLGTLMGLVGFYFTYISFVNPIHRFKKYLRNHSNWERFLGIEDHISIYRHKIYPSFQITVDWDQEVVQGFSDEWIMRYPFRDDSNHVSYFVRLEANGIFLQRELFVSLDGHRYFVPVPRIMIGEDGVRNFYYDGIQIQLAKIIGKFDFFSDIHKFVEQQKNLSINEYL